MLVSFTHRTGVDNFIIMTNVLQDYTVDKFLIRKTHEFVNKMSFANHRVTILCSSISCFFIFPNLPKLNDANYCLKT